MTTKPTVALSRWADTGAANVVDPPSGARDTGFVAGDPADEGHVNALINQAYLWHLYVDDAVFTGGMDVDTLTVGNFAAPLASQTFTASSATDELTLTAHGLQTGDGVVTVSNSGGALPAPLLAATSYFAIVTGANTFKLATTRARALSGVAINLTSDGTGTNTIVGAGATRVGTATVVGDLDATRLLPLVNACWPLNAARFIDVLGVADPFGTPSVNGKWAVTTGAGATFTAPLDLPVGTVLSKIRFGYDLAGASATVTFTIGSCVIATGAASDVALAVDTVSTTWTTMDVTNFGTSASGNFNASAGSYTIQPDRVYWLTVTFVRTTGTITFGGCVVNPD